MTQDKVEEVRLDSLVFPDSIRLLDNETAARQSKSKALFVLGVNKKGQVADIYTGYSRARVGDSRLSDYCSGWSMHVRDSKLKFVLVKPFVFEAALIPDGSYRGRSAFGGFFKIDRIENRLEMGAGNVIGLIPRVMEGSFDIDGKGVHGRWTLAKRGQSVHINPYDD